MSHVAPRPSHPFPPANRPDEDEDEDDGGGGAAAGKRSPCAATDETNTADEIEAAPACPIGTAQDRVIVDGFLRNDDYPDTLAQ